MIHPHEVASKILPLDAGDLCGALQGPTLFVVSTLVPARTPSASQTSCSVFFENFEAVEPVAVGYR